MRITSALKQDEVWETFIFKCEILGKRYLNSIKCGKDYESHSVVWETSRFNMMTCEDKPDWLPLKKKTQNT